MIIEPANRLKKVSDYYFSKKLEEIANMKKSGIEVFNLGIGNPDFQPPSTAVNALITSAQQSGTHGYQPYRCIPELREALSKWMGSTYGLTIDFKTEILPLMGSKEGIMHVSLAFLNPKDEVLIPELAYPTYQSVSQIAEAKVIHYPLIEKNNWEPDWDFLYSYSSPKVKLLWLNYPHMPTGTKADLNLFSKFIALAKEKNILLCHDNPYSLILNKTKPLSIFNIEGAKETCIELNSLSKSHNMAGWRVGWVTGREDYLNAIFRIKSNADSGMFLGIQKAAVEALKTDVIWHNKNNLIYEKRRNYVFKILETLSCTYLPNQEGLFVWAKISDHYSDSYALVDNILKEKHVFITPGGIFGEKGLRYIRISLCNDEKKLKHVLSRLA